MFLRGELRPIIAGPGNPAVYEQQMIEATIPNMQSMFSIRSWDQKRIGALALVTVSTYVTEMQKQGFQVTDQSVSEINSMVRDAYGPKAPQFKKEDFVGKDSWFSVSANAEKREKWLRAKGIGTAAELNAQNASRAFGWRLER